MRTSCLAFGICALTGRAHAAEPELRAVILPEGERLGSGRLVVDERDVYLQITTHCHTALLRGPKAGTP